MREPCSEEGVSEVVAITLLLGLTVIGVALVGIVFLSDSQPDEVPHAAIVAGEENNRLALVHGGGDALRAGNYRIYVDTGEGLVDRTDEFTGQEDGVWSIGGTLVYDGPGTPERVVVTAGLGGSETILAEPDFVGEGETGFSPDPVEPDPGSDPDPGPSSFIDYVIDENVFVYGNALQFAGDNVIGPGATVIVTGNLDSADTNLGASIAVSNIYIDGYVALSSGSTSLGSPTNPGHIYINGDLTTSIGYRSIYGDVHVNGNCDLEGVCIYDNVYVNGDLTLRREDTGLVDDARIYYTGTLTALNNVNDSTLAKCIHQPTVPGFTMPDQEIPSVKPADWYAARGYVPGGNLTGGMKVFASSYSCTFGSSASNVIIIASDGDITITGGWGTVTGVFFAPNGKVTFSGGSLEGVVIARDGFLVNSWGTEVTFRNIEEYISNPEDYPF